jgi:hypothetical protein
LAGYHWTAHDILNQHFPSQTHVGHRFQPRQQFMPLFSGVYIHSVRRNLVHLKLVMHRATALNHRAGEVLLAANF